MLSALATGPHLLNFSRAKEGQQNKGKFRIPLRQYINLGEYLQFTHVVNTVG